MKQHNSESYKFRNLMIVLITLSVIGAFVLGFIFKVETISEYSSYIDRQFNWILTISILCGDFVLGVVSYITYVHFVHQETLIDNQISIANKLDRLGADK